MKKNMGSIDRSIRVTVGVVLAIMLILGAVSGTWAWIAGIVAVLLIVTSAMGSCPAYLPFGLSTDKPKE